MMVGEPVGPPFMRGAGCRAYESTCGMLPSALRAVAVPTRLPAGRCRDLKRRVMDRDGKGPLFGQRFVLDLAVGVDIAIANLDRFAGQADHALDDHLAGMRGRAKCHRLPTPRTAPSKTRPRSTSTRSLRRPRSSVARRKLEMASNSGKGGARRGRTRTHRQTGTHRPRTRLPHGRPAAWGPSSRWGRRTLVQPCYERASSKAMNVADDRRAAVARLPGAISSSTFCASQGACCRLYMPCGRMRPGDRRRHGAPGYATPRAFLAWATTLSVVMPKNACTGQRWRGRRPETAHADKLAADADVACPSPAECRPRPRREQ